MLFGGDDPTDSNQVDDWARLWFDQRFETEFYKRNGEAFQELFSSIMECAHKGDFVKTRTWGNAGDMKNDGYLKSTRQMFQVYGPLALSQSLTEDKMEEDCGGAHANWPGKFDEWTFVHNSKQGLPPFVQQKLDELETVFPTTKFSQWGKAELQAQVRKLSLPDLESIFGCLNRSKQKEMLEVRSSDVRHVLNVIAVQPRSSAQEEAIKMVPRTKLYDNGLSDDVQQQVILGMMKSKLVGDYISRQSDPTYGDRLVASFTKRYNELDALELSPDIIFAELLIFAGSDVRREPRYQNAVLAVVAYLFEECDIFRPSLEEQGMKMGRMR